VGNLRDSDCRYKVNYFHGRLHRQGSISAQKNIYENGFESNTYRRDYAFFGNTEYDLTNRWTIIGGARYTDSLTQADISNYDLGHGGISALVTALGSVGEGVLLYGTASRGYLREAQMSADSLVERMNACSKTPATNETNRLVNLMRERGVLISRVGTHGNILKTRPPMPFSRQHADVAMKTMERYP
jgi:hypothetical protein